MTKKRVLGIPFEKGCKPGPGRSPLPLDIKEARALNKNIFERLLNTTLAMSDAQRKAVMKSKTASGNEKIVAKIVHTAILFGDFKRYNFLIERLLGKVAQTVQLQSLNSFIIDKLDQDGKPVVVVGVEPKKEIEDVDQENSPGKL